jgi:hypothetical protein
VRGICSVAIRWATACHLRVFGHIFGIVSRVRLAQVAFPSLVLSVLLFTSANRLSGSVYTFTNAGATGRLGPTQSQIDANYSGTNLANSVTIDTQGIQEWTVPSTGTYRIEVWGAQGGRGSWGSSQYDEGWGAKMAGNFLLNGSQSLKILVGQEGSPNNGSSGGGGSFVVITNGNVKLVIAGGGGGSGSGGGASGQSSNRHAVVTPDGMDGVAYSTDNAGTGGTNGGAGATITSSWNGYGGSGFLGNGAESHSFLNGGAGGPGYNSNSPGGFGSGGGGGMWGAGGGGGYSGGGNNSRHAVGGGGGSFNSGTDQNNTAGANQGHGKVIITQLPNSTYAFTNAGATGRLGPTQSQIDANYSGTNLANSVTIDTQGIQKWTVPVSGDYVIEASGAKGGGTHGGNGAKIIGEFSLSANEVLKISVGQMGQSVTSGRKDYSGGGGTYVVRQPYNSTASILAIAGGGGGAHVYGTSSQGSVATSGNAGVGGHQNGSGGTNGNGGSKDNQTSDGGAGFFTNGQSGNPNPAPNSFTNGGQGGSNSWGSGSSIVGGFGGGGGANRNDFSYWGGGGGGGYSGAEAHTECHPTPLWQVAAGPSMQAPTKTIPAELIPDMDW